MSITDFTFDPNLNFSFEPCDRHDRTADGPIIPPIGGSASSSGPGYGTARHLVFGTRQVLRLTIANLHKRGYAEPNDWCKPLPTGRTEEFMSILTKQVPLN